MAKGKKVKITDSVVNRSNLQFTGLDSEEIRGRRRMTRK
tara:strand:- start:96 stop:212 length:117 start_codon:yes stop_codon:yes gene_type:complete